MYLILFGSPLSLLSTLAYFAVQNYSKTIQMPNETNYILVYTFSNSLLSKLWSYSFVDAFTGKLVDYAGNPITSSSTELPVKDNWAKRSVELLADQGIIKKVSFDYSEGVSKLEAIKMLALAKGSSNYILKPLQPVTPSFNDIAPQNEFFPFTESAVSSNIIAKTGQNLNGNEIISKAEFTKLLINMIGYSDIAKFSEIFKVDSTFNVSSDLVGYVSIAKALGVLPVNPGEAFDGNTPVNYSEAAFALYKALEFVK